MKYIFITGGVVSSLGKGIVSGSLGALLESSGHKCTCMKLDPYINVDPGTMSPQEHGEVYVTQDGAETDLDLGHYERFLTVAMQRENSVTSGQVFSEVIAKERRGDYLGATVQVIPHITDQIKFLIEKASTSYDITLVEVGGTVGDIESLPFLEAIRQMRIEHGSNNVLFIHLTLLPFIQTAGEMKTKPTQHSVKELRSIGIQPDILVCRAQRRLTKKEKEKIGMFTNVSTKSVISVQDVDSIYSVPNVLAYEGMQNLVESHFGISSNKVDLSLWEDLVAKEKIKNSSCKVAIVGKYTKSKDAYKSIGEALKHGAISLQALVDIEYIDSDIIVEKGSENVLKEFDAVLVPGGFGERGIQGMLDTIKWTRENKVPFLGICLGMQIAVIEYARNVAGITLANSTEFENNCKDPVIAIIDELKVLSENQELGGTMRLGAITDILTPGSLISKIYKGDSLVERHRHRYEFNPKYIDVLKDAGLKITGVAKDTQYVDVIEIDDHPWFVACQFHPEFTSKPLSPHPLFRSFIEAGLAK